jgi:hypothetical protein
MADARWERDAMWGPESVGQERARTHDCYRLDIGVKMPVHDTRDQRGGNAMVFGETYLRGSFSCSFANSANGVGGKTVRRRGVVLAEGRTGCIGIANTAYNLGDE